MHIHVSIPRGKQEGFLHDDSRHLFYSLFLLFGLWGQWLVSVDSLSVQVIDGVEANLCVRNQKVVCGSVYQAVCGSSPVQLSSVFFSRVKALPLESLPPTQHLP